MLVTTNNFTLYFVISLLIVYKFTKMKVGTGKGAMNLNMSRFVGIRKYITDIRHSPKSIGDHTKMLLNMLSLNMLLKPHFSGEMKLIGFI